MPRYLGIDLGTSSILIYVKGRGMVLQEPCVLAIDRASGKILKAGQEASAALLPLLKPSIPCIAE